MDERVDASVGLFPHLQGHGVISGNLVRIVKLVRPERTRLQDDLFRGPEESLIQIPGHLSALAVQQRQSGAEGLHVVSFLQARRVGSDKRERMASDSANHRQRSACAPAGELDDRPARRQSPVGLGCVNHRPGHSVFHASRRVGSFELHDDTRASCSHDPAELDQRRISDRCQDVRGQAHRFLLWVTVLIGLENGLPFCRPRMDDP